MKVRALQSTYIDGTFRRGPELNDKNELMSQGEVFDVADETLINPEVLEVLEPPVKGKPRILKLEKAQPAAGDATS